MKKNIIFVFTCAAIVISFMQGCVPSKPVYEEKEASYDRLVKKVEINKIRIKSFYGIGSLNVFSQDESLSGNFEVFVKRPDSLKIIIYGPFGIDLAQMLVTKNNFKFYDVMNNTLYTGKNNKAVLKQLIKLDISFDELYESLTGAMSMTDRFTSPPSVLNSNQGSLQLTFNDSLAQRKCYYKVDMSDMTISNYKVITYANKEILTGTYTNYKITDEIAIPMKTTLEYKETQQKLIIEYRNYEVNKPIDNIDLIVPYDVKIVKW